MSEKDKISDLLESVGNPISAAKSTIESTRGLVQETYGLVEDVRGIAEKEKARREDRKEQRQVDSVKSSAKIKTKVASNELKKAAIEYNASIDANISAAKAALIRERQREEEHSLIWSMSQSERDAYLAEKKKQADQAIKEKLRIIKENDARQARNQMIFTVCFTIVFALISLWAFFLWLHYLTGKIPNVPGASWVR
jgi:preprotein translocase subunit SecF